MSHETLEREDLGVPPSNRRFGITMAAVFFVLFAAVGLMVGRWHWWMLVLSACFVIFALAFPNLLSRLNIAWYRFGLFLHRIVNPMVMGLIFAFITPIGVVWRHVQKDPLRLKFDPSVKSYWIKRQPSGPKVGDFPHQF